MRRSVHFFAALLSISAGSVWSAELWLSNARLIDGTGATEVPSVNLQINGNRIVAIFAFGNNLQGWPARIQRVLQSLQHVWFIICNDGSGHLLVSER